MKESWAEKLLGDVITLQRGFDLPERERTVGTVPIVSSSGITGYHSTAKVRAPGVVTGRYGTLGEVFYIAADFWPLNTTLWVKDFKGNDPHYVSYLLRTLNLGHHNAAGAVPGVNRNALHMLPVRVPPRRVQEKIAYVLSAYDDLIENNTRRIGILEQMAQMLYREWFVNFRFPGCEKLPLVGSILGDIPEGWEIADLASVCVERNGIQTGPFGSQLHMADYSDEGVPVVMPKDLIGFRIRTDEIARIPESIAEKLSRHRMQPDDIVYGRRGDIGRRAYLMPGQAGWFCGTGCLRIRPNSKVVNSWYLFNYLGQDDVRGIITGRALGVTMPNLSTGVMASVPVKLPPRDLQDAFARITFPMAEAREVLTAAIENLRRTRDLLLPKFVSGAVSVEQLEAEVPTLTA
jgi:type I restriction enzyme, S subunit